MLILILLTISTYSHALSPEINSRIETTFKGQPLMIEYFKQHMAANERVLQGIGDVEKWAKAREEFAKTLQCTAFIFSGTPLAKDRTPIIVDFLKQNQESDKKDFQMLMEHREKRRVFMGIAKEPISEGHKHCNPALPADFVATRQKELQSKEKEQETKDPDFSAFHPRDQEILKGLLKNAHEQKLNYQARSEFVFKTFITTIAPILNTKAEIEYLPNIERNCPGLVETYWKICAGKPQYPVGVFLNTPKMYCLMDHEKVIDPKCLKQN